MEQIQHDQMRSRHETDLFGSDGRMHFLSFRFKKGSQKKWLWLGDVLNFREVDGGSLDWTGVHVQCDHEIIQIASIH